MKPAKAKTLELFDHEIGQNPSQRADPQLERGNEHAPVCAEEVQGSRGQRFLVLVTSYRRRLLDEDNLCEKFHVDCCRHAGLLPDDSAKTTRIETRQILVKDDEDLRTEIEIVDRWAPDDDTGPNEGVPGS